MTASATITPNSCAVARSADMVAARSGTSCSAALRLAGPITPPPAPVNTAAAASQAQGESPQRGASASSSVPTAQSTPPR